MEANENIGGLTITQEITLPDFHSDLHAFGYQFANLLPAPDELGLDRYGLELLTPEICFAHAFPDGRTVRMYKDLEKTCASIASHSTHDAEQWRMLFQRWLVAKDAICAALNAPPHTALVGIRRADVCGRARRIAPVATGAGDLQ